MQLDARIFDMDDTSSTLNNISWAIPSPKRELAQNSTVFTLVFVSENGKVSNWRRYCWENDLGEDD